MAGRNEGWSEGTKIQKIPQDPPTSRLPPTPPNIQQSWAKDKQSSCHSLSTSGAKVWLLHSVTAVLILSLQRGRAKRGADEDHPRDKTVSPVLTHLWVVGEL